MPDNPDSRDRVLYVPEDVKAIHEPAWEAAFESLVAAPWPAAQGSAAPSIAPTEYALDLVDQRPGVADRAGARDDQTRDRTGHHAAEARDSVVVPHHRRAPMMPGGTTPVTPHDASSSRSSWSRAATPPAAIAAPAGWWRGSGANQAVELRRPGEPAPRAGSDRRPTDSNRCIASTVTRYEPYAGPRSPRSHHSSGTLGEALLAGRPSRSSGAAAAARVQRAISSADSRASSAGEGRAHVLASTAWAQAREARRRSRES